MQHFLSLIVSPPDLLNIIVQLKKLPCTSSNHHDICCAQYKEQERGYTLQGQITLLDFPKNIKKLSLEYNEQYNEQKFFKYGNY